jgi:4-alpha-glucanotransferase
VLLHPTSLPGGALGDEGYRFVDWLAEAGQRWWQVLPLGPPDAHGSPYSSASAFAGSPALLARPDAVVSTDALEEFVATHPYWIGAWSAFAGRDAIADQVRFTREWGALRNHANDLGVRILGDIPFYVAAGSADVGNAPELFRTNAVAGVPPDDWSATGQLWGNPLYDWAAMRESRYRWWIERFRRTLELVDAVRVDHFRGFVSYWAVPAGSSDARHGRWQRGPGTDLFGAVEAALGPIPVVAENLGVITPAVERLRAQLAMPGCAVLQFSFSDAMHNRPPAVTDDDFVYTGTHDNDTTLGWWSGISEAERSRVDAELARRGIEEADPSWKLIRIALASEGRVAIVPAQDLLGLGEEARMNRPGRADGNWGWRLPSGRLDRELAKKVRRLTEAGGRAEPESASRAPVVSASPATGTVL